MAARVLGHRMTGVARAVADAESAEGAAGALPARRASGAQPVPRVTARGKFLFLGDSKLYVRGVTYGTFRPDAEGHEFPAPDVVSRDFEMMSSSGVNGVRTYTVPPGWLLDEADRNGLRVMVGLAAERLVGYLNDGRREAQIAGILRDGVRECSAHPAVLCYAVANEIPAPVVRWLGRSRMERFLGRLCNAVREEDPEALVTYVNYPSTEYLQLPFVDFVAFNVFLESQQQFARYLARLQNIAGERPLVMTELGLDSIRNGEERQAVSLASQIETAFTAGCAGAFAYAWTDEWHRGGEDVEDWAFGLTRRDRRPKPALAAVRRASASTPLPPEPAPPCVSVVVCTYNGAATLADCLDGLIALEYPNYEVIVVDDGSTDATSTIAAGYPVRLIRTENRGLSAARNTGLEAATGEIIAYTDDDARPDPHWLQYMVRRFREDDAAGVGGPNLVPPSDGAVADCVSNSPGGPIHVLLSDREAEHIPGCNMAFRRSVLLEVGGFDPEFRVAGDDVDLCWRLQERKLTVGFSPAAIVWHHRRRSVRAYLRQQRGYGRAEALLERKWPHKYNRARHIAWGGRLYGKGVPPVPAGARRWRVYYGSQGTGLFQSLYQPSPGGLRAVPQMPEWYLVIALLSVLCLLGAAWRPLLITTVPLLALGISAVVRQAVRGGVGAEFVTRPACRQKLLAMRVLTAALHALQPAARLRGRLEYGLRPSRGRVAGRPRLPGPRSWALWSERWRDPHERLRALEQRLVAAGARIRRGGDYDRWDVEVEVGMLAHQRLLMCVEEHGGGAQLIRLRGTLRCSWAAPAIGVLLGVLAVTAALSGAPLAAGPLGGLSGALFAWLFWEAALATGLVADAVEDTDEMTTLLSRSRHPSVVRAMTLGRDQPGPREDRQDPGYAGRPA
jgi:O-antigen biosynthesis protein